MTAARAAAEWNDRWRCPVCGGGDARPRWPVPESGAEAGVDGASFRPSSESFGSTTGTVVACVACGHGSVADLPEEDAVEAAYAEAADPVSIREETGQVVTARRDLMFVEQFVQPRKMVDLGCWTGSFCLAAQERGWSATGVEPSAWASERARQRGASVVTASMEEADLEDGTFDLVVLCDVLEHLAHPAAALGRIHRLLRPGGVLFLTVPDGGSALARSLGRRWWSVLPMHLQYFTRQSVSTLLGTEGFAVEALRSHAKVFSGRYYAERLGGYQPSVGRVAVRVAELIGIADSLIAPDFRDRMAVVARSVPAGAAPSNRPAISRATSR